MKKLSILILIFYCLSGTLSAQYERSSVSLTGSGVATTKANDYRAIGINPANIAINKTTKKWHFSFLEMGGSLYTDALTRSELNNDFWSGDNDFTMQQKMEAANNFTNSTLTTDLDFTWFAISYQDEKFGLAFSINEKLHARFTNNELMADLMFLGKDASYFDQQIVEEGIPMGVASNPKLYSEILSDDARWNMNWYREYNLALGMRLYSSDMLSLYGGVGIKYLVGFGTFDIGVVDDELSMYSALNPVFDIDWGDASTPSRVSGDGVQKVGSGFGVDLGVTAEVANDFTVSLALTDLGTMTWDGNVYESKDQTLDKLESDGFDSYNVFQEAQEFDEYFGIFEWEGLEEIDASLPTLLRFGAQYDNGGIFGGGFDILAPVSEAAGSMQKAMFNFGGWLRPVNWIEISMGVVTGGNYKLNLPIGVTFNAQGGWEVGLAVRDYKTYFSENTPNVSFAMAFLRFGIN